MPHLWRIGEPSERRGAVKVGLFDHIEDAGRPLATLFDERIEFYKAADRNGFYAVHLAEHHCSPINMVPVPGVFLGALARETTRIKIGTLVYLLTLTSPLKMIEEICMLDHLSKGRLEVGVGRGVSPFELNYHKIAFEESRDIFIDAYQCVVAGLTAGETFSYEGKHFTYKDVPVALRPLQQPTPAFWYGSSNETGSTWAGAQGMHFTANGPTRMARENLETFKAALAKRGGAAQPKAGFPGGTVIGALREVFVADTDEEARRICRPAAEMHLHNINWLRSRHGYKDFTNRLRTPGAATFEDIIAEGVLIAGSPETVLRRIKEESAALGGINYLLAYMMFGNMQLADALRSQQLFAEEVMPKLADV
jgi:alkanesulfonate monooxygenase SsuD/methylene tetrahydromethanopterin reductase-like flavin-dependent oxidoreductase (luciferase family)